MKTSNFTSKPLHWLLALGGIVGWYSSFILTVDKIKLLENPDYISTCNVNKLLACGNVVKTAQASFFGFPNSIIGVSSFPILAVIGVLMILGFSVPKWMIGIISLASGLATVFVSWLSYQSIFVIGILCPYCIVVWGMTVPIFFLTLRDLLRSSKRSFLRNLAPLAGYLMLTWFLVVSASIYFELIF